MRHLAPIALLALGLMQMTGDLLGWPALKGIAAATSAAPAPKVFSSARGLESYSSRFNLGYRDKAGSQHRVELTPERYAALRGPYNRRNAYGAVLAFGPLLRESRRTRPLYDAVAHYALCGRAPLLREIGVSPDEIAGPIWIELEPRSGSQTSLSLRNRVSCS